MLVLMLVSFCLYPVEKDKSYDHIINDPQLKLFIKAVAEEDYPKAKALIKPSFLCAGILKVLTSFPLIFAYALDLGAKHHDKWLLKTLVEASEFDELEIVNMILANLGEPKEVTNERRQEYFLRAIVYAAINNHLEIVKRLRPFIPEWQTMQFTRKFYSYNTPLELVKRKRNTALYIALMKSGSYLGPITFTGYERFKKEEVTEELAKYYRYEYPISYRLLILQKEQIWAAQSDDKSIFHTISRLFEAPKEEKDTIRKHIFHYLSLYPLLVSPHLRDQKGNTILHAAARAHDLPAFIHIYLLNRKLMQALNANGDTPLIVALADGSKLFTDLCNLAHSR